MRNIVFVLDTCVCCVWFLVREGKVLSLPIQVLTQLINITVCYALWWNPLKYKLNPVNSESQANNTCSTQT